MSIKKWLLASSGVAMSLMVPLCFADDICSQYLSASDSAFYSTVSSSSSTAASIAQALEACESTNACYQINGINNCADTLGNRLFLSEYFAAANGNGASGGSFGATAPSSASTPNTNSGTANTANTPNKKSSTKTDSSIHWF